MFSNADYAESSFNNLQDSVRNFLSMNTTDRRLIAHAIPGINNVVHYLRVYAAFCWTGWCLRQQMQGRTGNISAISRAAFDKMDRLLIWSGVGVPQTGLIGSTAGRPANQQMVDYNFATNPHTQTRYLSAPNYRPSVTDGIGVVWAHPDGGYGLNPEAKALALAFDAALRARLAEDVYLWLADVEQVQGPGRMAGALQWLLADMPSAAEQQAFLALLAPRPGERREKDTRRSAAADLVLQALSNCGALGTRELMEVLARGTDSAGRRWRAPTAEHAVVLLDLAVLRVRTLQRLTLETLMAAYLEYVKPPLRDDQPVTLAQQIAKLIEKGMPAGCEGVGRTVGEDLADLARAQHGFPTLAMAEPFNPNGPSLSIRRTLKEANSNNRFAILYRALLCCKLETDNLLTLDTPGYRKTLQTESFRLPLPVMSRRIEAWRQRTPQEFMAMVIEHWCVNQHLRTATFRMQEEPGKNAFLLTRGEMGWQAYSTRPPTVEASPNRLKNLCFLLSQCGLLSGNDAEWSVTPAGIAHLARMEQSQTVVDAQPA